MKPAYAALVAITLIWGFFYLGIAILLDSGWDPVFVNAVRFTIAAFVLVTIIVIRGQGRELITVQRTAPAKLLLPAWAGILAGTALITFAQQSVTSGLASVMLASTPLFAAALGATVFFGGRRVGIIAWLGAVIGLIGVACLFLPTLGGDASWGIIMLLMSAFCFAFEAHLVAKWFANSNILVVTALMTLWTAVGFWAWTLIDGHFQAGSWPLVIVFAVMSNVLAFTVYLSLVRQSGPAFANVYTYFVPMIALLVGWIMNAEALTVMIIVGALLSLSGAFLIGRDSVRTQRRQSRELSPQRS